jgi:transposase
MVRGPYRDEAKRMGREFAYPTGAETASSVAGAYDLITPNAMMSRCSSANILGWVNRIFTIDMIDTRLVPDEQEKITPGEAVAGMILNGLGFANRPLSLTPQFFANKPLDLLFRQGIDAEMFNRFKLGRTLDEAYAYGCDLLFEELALAVCAQEGIDVRFHHLDTTSFSLTGD